MGTPGSRRPPSATTAATDDGFLSTHRPQRVHQRRAIGFDRERRLGFELTARPFPNAAGAVNLYGDERTIPITVEHSFLQTTTMVTHDADDDGLLALLTELRERVALENDARAEAGAPPIDRQPYWLAVGPGSVQLVFAREAAAAALRACGYLREDRHRQRLLSTVSHAGEQIPILRDTWRQLARVIGDTFERLASIAPPALELAVTTRVVDESVHIEVGVGAHTVALVTEPSWLNLPARGIVEWIVRAVNAALAQQQRETRLLIIGDRLVWLPMVWVAQFVAVDGRLRRCLEPDFALARVDLPVPVAYPPADAIAAFATTRLPADIVGDRNICSSDFKCPSREQDYPSVFNQLAVFAGVDARCPGLATADDSRHHYTVEANHRGQTTAIRLTNRRYAEVGPIVDYLNGILEATERGRRLYTYRTPGWDHGVLVASEPEAIELAHLRYIDPLAGPD